MKKVQKQRLKHQMRKTMDQLVHDMAGLAADAENHVETKKDAEQHDQTF